MVDERPRTAGVGALGHDTEARLHRRITERALAKHAEQLFFERFFVEQRFPLFPSLFTKHLPAKVEVHLFDLCCRHTNSQRASDDRPCAGAANKIEVVTQLQVWFLMANAQELFDAFEKPQCQCAANTAAIKREHSFRSRSSESF